MLLFYLSVLDTEEERMKMSEIYEVYQPLMLRYALKITANQQLAEDAVHDAFLAIIEHKTKYLQLSCNDLRPPIVIITKRKCLDLLKKKNRIVPEPIEDMCDLLESKDMPIEEQIIMIEDYQKARMRIAALDETSKLILEMKYVLGMTQKEIGAELNMTPSHVNTTTVRAKEKIRKILARGEMPGEQQTG